MTLETTKTRIRVTLQTEILDLTIEIHFCIDVFKRWVFAQFSDIESVDLGGIREKVPTL